MKVYEDVSSVDAAVRGAVLTVGNFDGVHLGHQRILRTARALAHTTSTCVAAMTFDPHPLALLRPEHAPEILTPWTEKLSQLEHAGADVVIRLKTDWPVLSLWAGDFVREILVKRIHPSYIVEGPNFGFGRDRRGNVDTLREMSRKGGFQVHVVEPYRLALGEDTATVVSSTVIRACLRAGSAEPAAACLGRPYTLIAKVTRGAGAGRKLGFPTINLDVHGQLIPASGVYAGAALIAGNRRPAAISIGRRQTLGGGPLVVEAFVLDASGDWYDQTVRLDLWKRLRDQTKFDTREALAEQIARDIEGVRSAATEKL